MSATTKTVLFDQSNVAYRMGTGIATYARNLAGAARAAGWGVQALLSADSKVDPKDPVLSEVTLFDAKREGAWEWPSAVMDAVRGVARAPFGYRPVRLAASGAVLRPSGSSPAFDEVHVVARAFEAARARFYVTGRFSTVRMAAAPALFHATFPLPIRVSGCPNIVTIHDLVPLRLPYMTLDNKRYFYKLVKKLLTDADHIVTVSEFSKRDIVALFGIDEKRITNTYQSVSLPASAVDAPDGAVAELLRNLYELEHGDFYLFLGALEPKKNVARLIDAYAASGSKRPLVIAGGQGWNNKAELATIKSPRFAQYRLNENVISRFERVRRVEYVPLNQLVMLLRGARAVLFPSVFEGFGLPVLEAMTLGTAVMTSDVTSMPEIAGDAALLVDPYDVTGMAAAIRRLDGDDALVRELGRRGRARAEAFSPAAYVERVREVYSRVGLG